MEGFYYLHQVQLFYKHVILLIQIMMDLLDFVMKIIMEFKMLQKLFLIAQIVLPKILLGFLMIVMVMERLMMILLYV